MEPRDKDVEKAAALLAKAERPVLVVGGQTITRAIEAGAVADAIQRLGMPTFLGGTARGLLGADSDIQFRHKRTKALKKADVVVVCGFPFDVRRGSGWKINPKAKIITVNRDRPSLTRAARPASRCMATAFPATAGAARRRAPVAGGLVQHARETETARDDEIAEMAKEEMDYVNPVALVREMEARIDDDGVLVVDEGDFVATAAYVVKPRRPLSWLDPGCSEPSAWAAARSARRRCVRAPRSG